jgi:hypothetical protein
MWAFLSAGPYPTNFDLKSLPQGRKKKVVIRVRDKGTCFVLLNFMRRHAGRDFSVKQLAAETGHRRLHIEQWFYQGCQFQGRSYRNEGIITKSRRGGEAVFRYEEAPLPPVLQSHHRAEYCYA